MKKAIYVLKVIAVLGFMSCSSLSFASAISLLIGDDDAFGNTQNALSVDGANFLNFNDPTIAPGHFDNEDGLDSTAIAPWGPYSFDFMFNIDTSMYLNISSATVTLVSGSIAKRDNGSGFGFSSVNVEYDGNTTILGDLLDFSTGLNASALEETIKFTEFDVSSIINTGYQGLFSFRVDGSSLTNPTDQFAFDYIKLELDGELNSTSVSTPTIISLFLLGFLVLIYAKPSGL